MIIKPTSTSVTSNAVSIAVHLSKPIMDGSLPEPRNSDTKISVSTMTARGSCFFGYQFEFSAFMIDSRMRSFSVLLAAMLVQEPKEGWVAKELILVSE